MITEGYSCFLLKPEVAKVLETVCDIMPDTIKSEVSFSALILTLVVLASRFIIIIIIFVAFFFFCSVLGLWVITLRNWCRCCCKT